MRRDSRSLMAALSSVWARACWTFRPSVGSRMWVAYVMGASPASPDSGRCLRPLPPEDARPDVLGQVHPGDVDGGLALQAQETQYQLYSGPGHGHLCLASQLGLGEDLLQH